MCQGLVFVYACRHRQVGEVRLCLGARQAASNAGCLASLTFMLTGKEPSRQCGDIKTSRRYLLEPCLACRVQADLGDSIAAASVYAFHGNSQHDARPVSPPAESGAFASDPSHLVQRPYVGELMSTAAASTATVAVAVAMPRPVVVARSHRSRDRRPSSAGPSSGSRSGRPESRGRTMATGSRSGANASRSRSTSRGRATARNSANRLPSSRASRRRRSISAAGRFATTDRLPTVREDAIPMVPMIPVKDHLMIPVKDHLMIPVKDHGKAQDTKGKGKATEKAKPTKNTAKDNATSPTSSSSRSLTFAESDFSIRSAVADSDPAAMLGLGVHRYSTAHRHAASGLSSGSATGQVASYAGPSFSRPSAVPATAINAHRSPPRNISDRLRAMRKVAKSEESFVCADAARIEGKGNFF